MCSADHLRKKVELMSEKKPAVVADAPAAEKATPKAAKAAKADKAAKPTTKTGKTAHRGRKVGVQSCKVYIKPEEEAAYYVVNKVSGKLPL